MLRYTTIVLLLLFLEACDTGIRTEIEQREEILKDGFRFNAKFAGDTNVKIQKDDLVLDGLGDCEGINCSSKIFIQPNSSKDVDYHLHLSPININGSSYAYFEWGLADNAKVMDGSLDAITKTLIYKMDEHLYFKQVFQNNDITWADIEYYEENKLISSVRLNKDTIESGVPVDVGLKELNKSSADGCLRLTSVISSNSNQFDYTWYENCKTGKTSMERNFVVIVKPNIPLSKHSVQFLKQNAWMSVATKGISQIVVQNVSRFSTP